MTDDEIKRALIELIECRKRDDGAEICTKFLRALYELSMTLSEINAHAAEEKQSLSNFETDESDWISEEKIKGRLQ